MSEPRREDFQDLPEAQMLRVNRVCNDYEARWQAGDKPRIEEFLKRLAAEDHFAALAELLPLEIEYRQQAGDTLSLEDFSRRFPQIDPRRLTELLSVTRGGKRPAAESPAVPEKLGDYQIVSCLGGGGMGTVYKAVHTRMGRAVALKVLRTEMRHDAAWLHRFDREVRVAARLSHPNIVAALDAREQDGLHYLVTELVEGADLESLVRESGPLPVAQAVDCILQAARGLDYAHRQGVIHRDIKPANLLRGTDGVVKVLDMGLARLDVPDETGGSSLTKAGMVMGTAAYMAPEQARDTRRADARSDIYSLGCTLHYMLTGTPLFTAETVVDTILSHVQLPVPSLAGIGNPSLAALDRSFQRMVAKEPANRFQSAAEVVAALEQLLPDLPQNRLADHRPRETPQRTGPAITANTPTVALDVSEIPPQPRKRSNPALWLVSGGVLVALLGALLVYSQYPKQQTEQTLLRPPPQVPENSLVFNGSSSYVTVPELIPTAGETYTVEAIVTPAAFRTSNVVSWLGPDWLALFIDETGHWGLARRVGSDSYLVHHEQPAALGKAVHLAGVYRKGDLRLFLDGQPVEVTRSTFGLPDTSGGLFLGGVPRDRLPAGQNDRFFQGEVDAVRVSRGVRYERPFEPPAKLAKDAQAIAVFTLDEGSGTVTRGTGERNWLGQIVDAQWKKAAK